MISPKTRRNPLHLLILCSILSSGVDFFRRLINLHTAVYGGRCLNGGMTAVAQGVRALGCFQGDCGGSTKNRKEKSCQ